jgi:hypothetical protein
VHKQLCKFVACYMFWSRVSGHLQGGVLWKIYYIERQNNLICKYNSVEITNKTKSCNRINYSTIHWRPNMFRAAYRSSSGALALFATFGLHTHVETSRSQVWVGTQTWLRSVTTCVCRPKVANTVRAPDDERYAARNMFSLQWTVE